MAAQEFFGGTIGSTYLGLAAAGALVFAIVPLERAAERLAEKAVPVSGPDTPAPGRNDAVDLYRTAVRHAMRDGGLSRAEERYLAELAERLGIGAATALDVRDAIESEPETQIRAEVRRS